jgi:hypothetical protein
VKEHLRRLASGADNAVTGASVAREYLQARTLEFLQDAGAFRNWAFLGGTALRFLYDMPRFSEDLDFSLIPTASEDGSGFKATMIRVRQAFLREGYSVDGRVRGEKTVASAWLKFPGLPHDLGLSRHLSETWSIKVELDTRPPLGARTETSVIRRHVTIRLTHYDKASLLAGKLHAVLSRRWTKGRDLYDLAWYLSDRRWPSPNLDLLNNALGQTGWKGPVMTEANWKNEVRRHLESVDWKRAENDVRPFLERPRDLALVSAKTLADLLRE